MSCVPTAAAEACANCGKHGSDVVKLRNCNACRLVKYCGVDCQRAHRKRHKRACKQRAAELEDEQLYSRGHERPEEDFCSICTLPIRLPVDDHSGFSTCCMQQICTGCIFAAFAKRGMAVCLFCRAPRSGGDADVELARIRARVDKNDPTAICLLGQKYYHGNLGLQKDVRRAAGQPLFELELAYQRGEGVEQNEKKAVRFYTKAAKQGHVLSRNNLGCIEGVRGNQNRAVRHWLISAKMGDTFAVEKIKNMFMIGFATKEQYAEALTGYQVAVEEMRSHDRDEAKRLGGC
ncbi:hypothetical protein THAOC_22657 [Thalassiosira oceanica]|uniref:MYND-type domain-containing protein n=1 Tax=Thalassiosira oceanica TaxID=159749 RepID=K0RWF6_THAOC|nr:hypothetical protein THAOC_22657 [Thalassiosira oceanica]|eukprot:EJK57315.1 hypothetical protein THAOC_22657 [Thalassiosira oceanica]